MDILTYMNQNILLLDGAMGTLLQAKGLQPGEYPERWNESHPEAVIKAHKAYFDAGSNVVLTNTFGANGLKFSDEELSRLVLKAVENAKKAAAESEGSQEKFVALDIGPLGRLLKPYGDLEFEEAVDLFKKTVKAGLKGDPDLIFIETMNDSYETKAALLAARESTCLPVFVSNSYGSDGRLMTGAEPKAMAALLSSMGADAIGVNCSLGPVEVRPIVEAYLKASKVPVFAKPNAGLPVIRDGKTEFPVTPSGFAEEISGLLALGLSAVGGCCGTNPEFIRALSEKTEGMKKVMPGNDEAYRTVISSYTHALTFGKEPVVIGERINPTGKKRLKQALLEKDLTYVLNEANGEAEAGSDVLDVNAGMPEICEKEMLPLLVKEIQTVTDLPLVIDTADPSALENALRIYNGKALINSVNGKQESMDQVFPLVKKYGGAVIALTLDEKGIPETAEGRFKIAERIIKEGAKYGIGKEEFVIDPLALTVSASKEAAGVTLETVRLIREKLGVCTSLGVSNISFGLPERSIINRTFLAMCLEEGLSAAILNPLSCDMMDTVTCYKVLKGMDEGCLRYIGYCAKRTPEAAKTVTAVKEAVKDEAKAEGAYAEVYRSVTKGMKEQAGKCAEAFLNAGTDPMELISEAVIPALNEVGEKFEKKVLFLPQLLLSAEAAGAVFESVKKRAVKTGKTKEGKVVLATVHGDIHDIGKGIVRLLLENYGFDVLDLGKDVPEETVVKAVKEWKAPLCGLSALMTTTVPAMEKTIGLIHEECPWCKVAVGGAVLTGKYADMIGADCYCATAMDTVRYAEKIIG